MLLNGFSSRTRISEGVPELANSSTKLSDMNDREKTQENMNRVRELCDITKICIIGIPERDEKQCNRKHI